jgi:hypothetical protein
VIEGQDRNDWSYMILRDHCNVLQMKPSGEMSKILGNGNNFPHAGGCVVRSVEIKIFGSKIKTDLIAVTCPFGVTAMPCA